MNTIFLFVLALFVGYFLSSYMSHPARKNSKLPRIKIKNIEILPNFKVHFRKKTIWLHHWMLFSVIVAGLLFVYEGAHNLVFLKGAFLGCVIEGLRYPDRFRISYPRLLPPKNK